MFTACVTDSIDEQLVGGAPQVVDRVGAYFADVASGLGRSELRRNAELYARGLMEAGARKSLEPLVARLGGGNVEYEALQHFLADSSWDPAAVDRAVAERVCAVIEPEAWVLDDTGVPKDGKRSPGVKRQYSGTLGKIGICQIAVSLHAVGHGGTVPLGFGLYLPEDWCADPESHEGEDPGGCRVSDQAGARRRARRARGGLEDPPRAGARRPGLRQRQQAARPSARRRDRRRAVCQRG